MEQKKAYTAAAQQLNSVYTGHDKATIENHFKFVLICHKYNAAAVYCLGFVIPCHAAYSVDSITDYN